MSTSTPPFIEQSKRSVLVVDDDEAVRSVLVSALERDRYTVDVAADVDGAIRILDTKLVSVVIIDKNLQGGRTGIDLLRYVSFHLAFTKSIMLTGYASLESAIEAVRCGAFDYLTKPINLVQLRGKVDAAAEAFAHACEQHDALTKYQHLFETIPGLVWFMTDDGVVRRINRAGAGLLGYAPDQLVGKSYQTLLADNEQGTDVHWAFNERRTGRRATKRQLAHLQTRAGEHRVFEIFSAGTYGSPAVDTVSTSQRDDNPRPWGTVGLALDVTELMTLQEQLRQTQKMEALGRLASGVAHDFNNLLTVILGSVELLEEPDFPDTNGDINRPEDLRQIRLAALRAAEMTKQLLSFSREQPFDMKNMSLGALVGEMQPMIERLIREDIRLTVTYPARSDAATADTSAPDDIVYTDKTQLGQVLMNLVVNACDAMPEGGELSLDIDTVVLTAADINERPGMEPGQYVRLVVTDTGIGMPESVKQRAFDPFYTTKAEGKGTGLGLATVYGIVRQHDGHIHIDSQEGVGTAFTLHFPSAGAHVVHAASTSRADYPHGTETILVVEDEALVQSVLKRILEACGYTVLLASNGRQASDMWQRSPGDIDLVIADLVMPHKNGSELANDIRSSDALVPIVFISGHADDVLAEYDIHRPGTRFLPKPLRLDRLLVAIRELLDARPE